MRIGQHVDVMAQKSGSQAVAGGVRITLGDVEAMHLPPEPGRRRKALAFQQPQLLLGRAALSELSLACISSMP